MYESCIFAGRFNGILIGELKYTRSTSRRWKEEVEVTFRKRKLTSGNIEELMRLGS